jgi:hypothetical protein
VITFLTQRRLKKVLLCYGMSKYTQIGKLLKPDIVVKDTNRKQFLFNDTTITADQNVQTTQKTAIFICP